MNAFVYCWTDHRNNKLYVGSHKGSINDGYICSSSHIMPKEATEKSRLSRLQNNDTSKLASNAGKESQKKRKDSGYYQSDEWKLICARSWQTRRKKKEGLVNGD